MSTTIESLELEILSSSESAESGLDKLKQTLVDLRGATKGGIGLRAVINQLKDLDAAVGTISSSKVASIEGLVKALSPLSSLPKNNLSSYVNSLKKLPEAFIALKSADFEGGEAKLRSLVATLTPLSSLPKSNLSSYVSSLKKLPEVLASLDDSTISVLTDKIKKLATALKPLGDEMQKVANGFSAFPAKIQKLISNTNSLTTSNNRAATSYVNFYAKLKMVTTGLKNIGNKIASAINEMNSYIENVNLFNASMGSYASSAQAYAEKVGEVMGIDPGEWMRNQGVFMTLATGFGVAGDRAAVMSQQLTQLGYDLSSFFNISYTDAMEKLQSGLSGELEPLRRLGYDLSQAKLEAVALSLGIDKSVSSMTQAEKAQLRYYAIMTQVTTAQGDMARTLNAPANQLRIFKAQVNQAARAIGSIFIPALNAILPYAIAVAKVIRILASTVASLFGFEMPEVDYSGVEAIAGGTDDISDAMEDATKSAKKLKTYLLGFDELNVLNPDDDDSTLSGLEGISDAFDFELPTYDFISEATESRVNQIVEDMKKWLGITDDIDTWAELMDTRLGNILKTVGLIGGGLGAWKLTKGLIDAISTIKELLKNPTYSIAIGAVLTITGFSMEFSGIKDAIENGLSGFNFGEIVGGALLGVGGSAILGSSLVTWIGKAFSNPKVAFTIARIGENLGVSTSGAVGAALGAGVAAVIAGIPAFITGIYDSIKNGMSWLSATLTVSGSTLAGAGIGAIIGACGGPVTAGMGALAGLAVGALTDAIIAIAQNWGGIKKFFAKTVPEWFSKVNWKNVGKTIGKGISRALTFLASPFKGILDTFEDLFDFEIDWKKVGESIGKGLGKAVDFIGDVGSFIAEWLNPVSLSAKIISWIVTTDWKSVKTKLKDSFMKAFDIGKDLLAGLVEGLKNGWKDFWSDIKDFIDGFVKGFKEALGIHSPSTVFAEIGKYTIQGWFEGMLEFLGSINDWCKEHIIDPFNEAMDGALKFAVNVKNNASEWWSNVKKWWREKAGAVSEFTTNVKNGATTWWNNTKKWWSEKVGAVSGFTTNVKNGAKVWWYNTRLWWSEKVGAVASFTTNVKNNAKTWWSNVKTWWSEKVGAVASFTTNVKNSASNWWDNVKTWWKKSSSEGVDVKVNPTKGWTGTLQKLLGIDDIVKMKITLPKIGITWASTELAGFEVKYPKFYTYAQGGFPDAGQMFIAREAGPELVGNIGSRTAVANNDQIVESVSAGVYQAVVAALGGNSDDGDTRIVINLDGEKIYENQQKIARNRGYNLGMGAFAFG